MRIVLLVVVFAGCVIQTQGVRQAIDPPATGGGTLSCRQIVEQCDTQCTDPMCVRACGNQGTADAAALHNAVVDCAQRNSCMDMPCIETNCAGEANACKGPDPAGDPAPATEEPPPPVIQ